MFKNFVLVFVRCHVIDLCNLNLLRNNLFLGPVLYAIMDKNLDFRIRVHMIVRVHCYYRINVRHSGVIMYVFITHFIFKYNSL